MSVSIENLPSRIDTALLQGSHIRLEPLLSRHHGELAEISSDPSIWRYLTSDAASSDAMRHYIDSALRESILGTTLPFVVRAEADGRLLGMTRLKSLSRENRKALVGSWFAPFAWGSGANAESKFLLLRYAFESLECLRIEFQADSRNSRSRAALIRMGAQEEGVLRSHLIALDGHRRDTVIFSVLIEEWPEVKQRLQDRLAAQRALSG